MNSLTSYSYTAPLPPGFNAMPLDPFGGYMVLPPGSSPPPFSMALIWISPIAPAAFPTLLQTYYEFDNPMVAMSNAYSLGLINILQVAPLRQSNMNGASAYIREFDAVSQNGHPTRLTAILLQGPASALQVIVGVNLYQWAQFIGPALQFVAGIQLTGTCQGTGSIQAFMEHPQSPDVQFAVVNHDGSATPLVTLPAQNDKGQSVVINYYGPVQYGNKNDYSGNFSNSDNQFGDKSAQNVRKQQ
jgi:hypothetical protein